MQSWQELQYPIESIGGEVFTTDYYANVIGPGVNGAIGNMVAGAAAQSILQIPSDSAFQCWKITFSANEHGATEMWSDAVQVPVTVFIVDGGSGRQILSQPVFLHQIGGPGRQPFLMPGKRIFLPNSTVTFTWANLDTNQWDNIGLVLHGRKIFNVTPT
jgi:hypothetical protein